MVRATRSTTQQPPPGAQPAAVAPKHAATVKTSGKKAHSKKRKRASTAADGDPDLADEDEDGQPATKLARQEATYKDAADTPLPAQDALRILHVLAAIDVHGLLDRAFPPPARDEPSSSSAPPLLSLRQLLSDAPNHPLRVLRDAVQPLFPVTSHARSRNSSVADEQIHFCRLACALLEQASRNTVDLTGRVSAFLEENDVPARHSSPLRKYAMMQKLPNGEWWTSALASDDPRAGLSPKEAKTLAHGQAELVSILPSIVATPEDTSDVPKLGDYAGPKKIKRKLPQLQPAPIPKLVAGSFLDYGPYASFAPSFDSDAAEVGRDALGELYDTRARRRQTRLRLDQALRESAPSVPADEAMQVDDSVDDVPSASQFAIDPALTDLSSVDNTPNADVDDLMEGIMAELDLERSVSELLERNARALVDLEVMQMHRLKTGAPLQQDGEEERTAQEIVNTLSLLAELRPRAPDNDQASIVHPSEALHALQRSLPLDPVISWKGTLDDKRRAALRDNNTVRVKVAGTSTSTAATTKAAAPSAAAATPQPFRPPPGYAFPPPNPYYPNAQFQSPTPGMYPPWPGFYPYPYPPPPGTTRDKNVSLEAAQKFYGYAAPGAQGNAAKGTPPPNGWYPPPPGGVPVTLPPHLRRFPAAFAPGTPTPSGR